MTLGSTPRQSPNLNSMIQGASSAMGNVLTGIGQYGSDVVIGGQGRPIPFPFNQGLIAKSAEAGKQPLGSPQQVSMYIDMAKMAGITSPTAKPSLIHPIDMTDVPNYNDPQVWKKLVNNTATSRPQSQILLEQASKAKDFKKVGEILDNIPSTDPYKGSMEGLFRGSVPVADDFDTAVDMWNGQAHGSLPDMIKAQDTILKEAKVQLTPQELEKYRGNIDTIINLVQSRLRRQE